jgi:peptidoglycan hydrolase-like protein with peptidoglycan-binding domain
VPAFPGVTRPGARGGPTEAFQRRLAARKWDVAVDGRHGPQTTAVLKAFQREKGLQVDGIGGPATWQALWTAPVT